ncbi:hypothetical protein [Halorussus halophilus]|uniref:hypothetical protein n=1 Tax=Halorussus halophilus TaxID=2650975 RepID=UPI001787B8C1|nr:hypothetical protein [Halorussus halophilus]
MSENIYHVYLVRTNVHRDNDQPGEREITSPVEGYAVDFYDSGVWLSRETGRNFFPYEQVRTIREHPAGQPMDEEEERMSVGKSSEDGPTQEELADPDS